MAQDPHSLRRRAAQAVLGGMLSEEEMEAALVAQQDLMRSDGISSIVAFIDHVASGAMLDAATCKRLYGELYRALTGAPEALPADPWAARLAVSRAAAAVAPRVAPVPAPQPAPAPVPVLTAPLVAPPPAAPVAADPIPEPVPAPVAEPEVALPAPQAVFSALVGEVRNAMQQYYSGQLDELRVDLLAVFKKAKYAPATVEAFLAAWDAPNAATWQAVGEEKTLAELVHFLYRALCETLGPVDADQVLTRAVQEAEKTPQASSFPPARLL